MSDASTDRKRPALTVIRGDATPEEIAALLVVVAARSRALPEPKPRQQATWTDRGHALRAPAAPGPGAWRASAWPR